MLNGQTYSSIMHNIRTNFNKFYRICKTENRLSLCKIPPKVAHGGLEKIL
jgi:hypothetical protein